MTRFLFMNLLSHALFYNLLFWFYGYTFPFEGPRNPYLEVFFKLLYKFYILGCHFFGYCLLSFPVLECFCVLCYFCLKFTLSGCFLSSCPYTSEDFNDVSACVEWYQVIAVIHGSEAEAGLTYQIGALTLQEQHCSRPLPREGHRHFPVLKGVSASSILHRLQHHEGPHLDLRCLPCLGVFDLSSPQIRIFLFVTLACCHFFVSLKWNFSSVFYCDLLFWCMCVLIHGCLR